MPPRTSTTSGEKPRQSLKRKSLSTTALEQVEALLPATCTPGYIDPSPRTDDTSTSTKRKSIKSITNDEPVESTKLTEDQKAALLVEVLGFQPTELLQDITESARQQVDKTVLTIENWLSKVVRLSSTSVTKGKGKGAQQGVAEEGELMLEVDQGLHGLETLLNDHMDSALDKLTSWALRNTFEIPDDLRLTLPWHEGLDFDRGVYVASLPEGETSVQKNIEELREQVENMRKLKHGLTLADRAVGEKVKAMQRQKDAIGFITTLAAEANITSLPTTAREITQQMDSLHASLSEEFDTVLPVPAPAPPLPSSASTNLTGENTSGTATGGMTREWEFGRAAYLSWAVSRAIRDRQKVSATATSGLMDVDTEGPIAGPDGDAQASDKRLDELVKLTRHVSGTAATGEGDDRGGEGSSTGTGAGGLGWALQGLVDSQSKSR